LPHLPPEDLSVIGTIEQIYRLHRKGLFALALAITGRPEAAEDAVHDAIVRLCRSGKIPAGDPVAYVFATVRNAAVDQKRKTGSVSIFDLPEPLQLPNSALDDLERDRLIAGAIEDLPEDQREAVIMHLYTGLTFQQAAEVLELPLQTIASRYRRALAKLREQLVSLK
jgi:RNA polymerase sigma-70 factor, ECF subfamily